jgi:pilus assembly protein Flp/PilA
MTHFFKTFFSDTSGAAAAEYALILAIIGTAIALGAANLGSVVGKALESAADKVATPAVPTK